MKYEQFYFNQNKLCVGTDEVGRGCLAGPVVAASACILDPTIYDSKAWIFELNDSKKLSQKQRESLLEKIKEDQNIKVHVAWAYPDEIDRWNILHASMVAMKRALYPFVGLAEVILVDGHLSPFAPIFSKPGYDQLPENLGFKEIVPVVKGDSTCISIAAASVVAKVYRDQWMEELDTFFPKYGFKSNKGYPTTEHQKALQEHGYSEIHRKSFGPIKEQVKAEELLL
ncbi:MAG: ribonuclease HII [Bacteriovoracia bacterium]